MAVNDAIVEKILLCCRVDSNEPLPAAGYIQRSTRRPLFGKQTHSVSFSSLCVDPRQLILRGWELQGICDVAQRAAASMGNLLKVRK